MTKVLRIVTNMCCDAWNNGQPIGECPACGEPIDEDGDAVTGCNYSPVECKVCGSAPCDDSC
jgi:hypothetical protein